MTQSTQECILKKNSSNNDRGFNIIPLSVLFCNYIIISIQFSIKSTSMDFQIKKKTTTPMPAFIYLHYDTRAWIERVVRTRPRINRPLDTAVTVDISTTELIVPL